MINEKDKKERKELIYNYILFLEFEFLLLSSSCIVHKILNDILKDIEGDEQCLKKKKIKK